MDMRTYLSGAERGAASALAKSLGVSAVMVSQWAAGVKPVPADRASDIEIATNAAVRRWDLRPDDWHRIWPELIAAPGAPAPQASDGRPVPDVDRIAEVSDAS